MKLQMSPIIHHHRHNDKPDPQSQQRVDTFYRILADALGVLQNQTDNGIIKQISRDQRNDRRIQKTVDGVFARTAINSA